MNSMTKRGQEEIVGFVAVVVIIMIVALIFLVFSVRVDEKPRESVAARQLIESIFEIHADCSLYGANDRAKIGELIRACQEGRNCASGEESCKVLNRSIVGAVSAAIQIGELRPIKGYTWKSDHFFNASEISEVRNIVNIVSGNCTQGMRKEGYTISRPGAERGVIRTRIEFCSNLQINGN